jgi:hypothetical protein
MRQNFEPQRLQCRREREEFCFAAKAKWGRGKVGADALKSRS